MKAGRRIKKDKGYLLKKVDAVWSLLETLLFVIIFFNAIFLVIDFTIRGTNFNDRDICMLIGTLLCILVTEFIRERIENRLEIYECNKAYQERRKYIKSQLTGEFKEVQYISNCEKSDEVDMLMNIIHKEGCIFLARLCSKGIIELVVKDKYEKIVYTTLITSFEYFSDRFDI